MAKARASGRKNKATGLSAERIAAVHAAAAALPSNEVTRAPGALGKRLPRMVRATQTALAKGAALVAVPMAPDAPLTSEELRWTADLVAVLAMTVADVGAAAAQPVDPAIGRAERDARAAQAAVLRGIRHLFRSNRAVLRWALKIKRGEGIADLVNDAGEMKAFWALHAGTLAALTQGEGARLESMVALAEGLRPQLHAVSGATALRKRRDAVYTLASRGLARIRAAAGYAFAAGDPVLAAFRTTPPRRKKKAAKTKG